MPSTLHSGHVSCLVAVVPVWSNQIMIQTFDEAVAIWQNLEWGSLWIETLIIIDLIHGILYQYLYIIIIKFHELWFLIRKSTVHTTGKVTVCLSTFDNQCMRQKRTNVCQGPLNEWKQSSLNFEVLFGLSVSYFVCQSISWSRYGNSMLISCYSHV